MSTLTFLDHLRGLRGYNGQIVHTEHLPAREPRYGRLEQPLPAPLAHALDRKGVRDLFTHQAEAVNAVRHGENVVVATSTASGKTLCYNLPVLESVLKDGRTRALYIFPTKALAQDQLRSLRELSGEEMPSLRYDTFDGDTPQARRSKIKKECQIILTNPDMLSRGILPNHSSWARFLANLRYVVIDEAHVYRGIFGSHVANVMRRLTRICRFYGANPQFVCCSATIANPQELVAELTGADVTVVNDDGSPHGPKDFVFWNPPVLDKKSGARRSTHSEATALFTELIQANIRTLAFAKTRRVAELLLLYSRQALQKIDPALADRIRAYRAGYRPEDRREIERLLFNGQLLGVTATNALELGVDIGSLDATVLTGYPGTIASTWQQAGRAGRSRSYSMSFLVGLDNPLDQYLMRHPDEFFRKIPEHALINPTNPHILSQHLLCAAYEMPLTHEDEVRFGGEAAYVPVMVELEKRGFLRYTNERWYYAGIDYPAENVNIRSTSSRHFNIVDTSRPGYNIIETIDAELAFFQVYPGAIYLHQGDAYQVTKLDLYTRNAFVMPADVNYYTQARDLTDVRIIQSLRSRSAGTADAFWGKVRVTTQVIGYRRKQQYTDTVLSDEPLELPPQAYETTSLWFIVPSDFMEPLRRQGHDIAGALHAIEHTAIGLLPLYAMCDRNDIGGLSMMIHPDAGAMTIFIYDGPPGGVGISEKGFEMLPQLWRATLQLLRECPCEDGCPSCVQSPKCGNNNQPLDKAGARMLLEMLLGERVEGGGQRVEGSGSRGQGSGNGTPKLPEG
jgi:DEAD/DEAH box helicase domain-containing protein